MDNTKFNLVSIILFIVLIGLGALAIITLTPPKRYSATTQQETTSSVATTDEQDASLGNETPVTETPTTATTGTTTTPATTPTTPAASGTLKNAELIASLQKLLDAKVILKAGDKGANVATVQTFFNVYNKTNDKVDSDFGPGLTSTVKSFQSKNSITPQSGQIAEKTLTKMIEWLKAQG